MANETAEMAGWNVPQQGTFCWTEIGTTNADACQAFYSEIFGWKFKSSGDANTGMDYREFWTDSDRPAGGLYQMDPKWFGGEVHPAHFMIYVHVDDVDDNARLVEEMGGKILRGPLDIPNVGRMAIIQDPTGAVLATFRMKTQEND